MCAVCDRRKKWRAHDSWLGVWKVLVLLDIAQVEYKPSWYTKAHDSALTQYIASGGPVSTRDKR